MAAYNRVDGAPAAASARLLGETLRKEWGFAGYVVGDCGAVDDIFAAHHRGAVTGGRRGAWRCGRGPTLDCGRAYAALRPALAQRAGGRSGSRSGSGASLHRAVSSGAVRSGDGAPWSALGAAELDSPAHRQLARERRRARSCCWRIETAPCRSGGSVKRIAVVGPTADDEEALLANYHGTPAHAVTLLEGLRAAARARGAAVRYARGATLAGSGGSSAQLREAITAARRSDVVVAVLGLDPRLEGEENDSALNPAGDRRALGLPASQEKLLEAMVATGKPVVVVLTGGSALAVPFAAAHATALLDVWYPGEEGGNAVADVLFGEANPAGRLPITIYRSAADLPPFADYAMRGRTYRYLERPPLHRFGDGLSYTTFRYANLTVASRLEDDLRRDREQRHAGRRRGGRGLRHASRSPAYAPHLWLAAFARLSLTAGERRTISLALPAGALTLVDERGQRRPLTGAVDIAVGGAQPDRDGRYADGARGLTASARLGN